MMAADALSVLVQEMARAARPYRLAFAETDEGGWLASAGARDTTGRWVSEASCRARTLLDAVRGLAEDMRGVGLFEVLPPSSRADAPADSGDLAWIDAHLPACLAALYAQQTPDERVAEETRHRNARGFDVVDAPHLTRTAAYVAAGGRLDPAERRQIARRLARYRRQLRELVAPMEVAS